MKVFLLLFPIIASSLARPEIGIEKKFETSREISAQQLTPLIDSAHLPSVPNPNAEVPVLMFFPEYNVYLVPAETFYSNENVSLKRRRPMASLIKLIQQRRIQTQQINRNISDPVKANANSEEITVNKRPSRPLKVLSKEPDNSNITEKEDSKNVQANQEQQPEKDESSENKGYTFGQIGQLFQRPENSASPSFPMRPQKPQFQVNRPLLATYLSSGLSGWRPFGNLFQQQYAETPRDHYVQYLTKSTPIQTQRYYYDQYSPRMPQINTYADDIQDYVSQIQESVMKETSTDTDTSMMLATLPIGKNTPTSLLLRPVAKAVAGAKGVAVASPVAKAVLRKGEKVNIDFDPDAVAIAGPGGQAHAHPKLVISYSNDTKQE